MAKARVTIDFASHYKDWDALRKSQGVVDALDQMGAAIAARADANAESYIRTMRREGFSEAVHGHEVTQGSKRCRCTVWTKSYAAKLAQARANTLQNSLHAGALYF